MNFSLILFLKSWFQFSNYGADNIFFILIIKVGMMKVKLKLIMKSLQSINKTEFCKFM